MKPPTRKVKGHAHCLALYKHHTGHGDTELRVRWRPVKAAELQGSTYVRCSRAFQ